MSCIDAPRGQRWVKQRAQGVGSGGQVSTKNKKFPYLRNEAQSTSLCPTGVN